MPWLMVAKTGGLLAVALVIFAGYTLVNNRINDYIQTKESLVQAEIQVAEKEAVIDFQNKLAEQERIFQNDKIAIIEETNEKLSEAREREVEAKAEFTASRLEEVSNKKQSEHSSITVNERLTNRAAKATRRKFDRIESLSRWVYDDTNTQ